MFNKYKVAIADVEDTPSCDDEDVKCGKTICGLTATGVQMTHNLSD